MRDNQTDSEWIADVLLYWEEAFELGQDIPAETLCGWRYNLIPIVKEKIEILRRAVWMKKHTKTTGNELPKRNPSLLFRSLLLANRYELKEKLGSGGFGEVWRAFDQHLQRPVAVKMPHAGRYPNDAEARIRFLAEAQRVEPIPQPPLDAIPAVVA